MHIINARLRNREGLHDLHLEHGRIASITPHTQQRRQWGPMTWMQPATW